MNGEASEKKNGANPSQTNASNIWQTMVKTVRDVDTQKVDDTKEDIDTLLVFAGLFSAVVTTFVVDSYASLTPDNTDELVFLMRQSLSQNYTFVDGVLRPMAPFPDDPPFEAPLWALRVNGLWFASLIVSLSTASFGMLVKQWLVEYVAMEQWISPQEQLRARQYRHPGLEHWRVFEIAALLPLLLHVSLGLFFLGLCFYTAAANQTIGRSTFPLVAGWAFFALLTFIAPLASPRCPYKVTLLKAGLRAGRRYITSRLWRPGRAAMNGTVDAARWVWWNVVCMPYRGYRVLMRGWARLVDVTLDISVLLWIPVFTLFLPFVLFHFVVFYVVRFVNALISDPGTDDLEEADIMRKPYKTHELLLSVDEVIINDGPILETMVEVLKQTHTPPHFVNAFVLGCIQHRIGTADRDRWIPNINNRIQGLLDLRTLSEGAWTLLVGLIGETLAMYIPEKVVPISVETDSHSLWMANAVAILLSESQWPVPEHISPMLTVDTTLAKMLQLVRTLVVRWPQQDIMRMIWIAFIAPGKTPGVPSVRLEREWGRLPSRNGRTLSQVQISAMQVLLENAWRGDSEQSLNDFAEAVLMLLYILNASSPQADDTERQITFVLSSYGEQEVPDVNAAMGLLRPEYTDIASHLEIIVSQSSSLIVNALNLYSVFLAKSLRGARVMALWEIISRMEGEDILSPDRHAVMHDLWRFLLKCARSASTNAGVHLQTSEFVKLCIVLARPGIPRAFDRDDPVRDWNELVPVLEKTASEEVLTKNATLATAAEREYSIPTLAYRALQALSPGDPDVPDLLVRVLTRLADKGPKPPPKPSMPPVTRKEERILGMDLRLPFTMPGNRPPPGIFVTPPNDGYAPSDIRSGSRSPAVPDLGRQGSGRLRPSTVLLERGPSPPPPTTPTFHLSPDPPYRPAEPVFVDIPGAPPPGPPEFDSHTFIHIPDPPYQDSGMVFIDAPSPRPPSPPSPPLPRRTLSSAGFSQSFIPPHAVAESTGPAGLFVPSAHPDHPREPLFHGAHAFDEPTIPQSPRPSLPSVRRPSTTRSASYAPPTVPPSRASSVAVSRPHVSDPRRMGSLHGKQAPAPPPAANDDTPRDAQSRRTATPTTIRARTPPPQTSMRSSRHRSRSHRADADETHANQSEPLHRSRSASQAPSSYSLADKP
ncbi:hypothetical protein PsYK624_115940 [Phanerochaete sordida]|uniref:DUF6535 domain-containing protein n=1 Tax=Phanerochaete sordida TaxID=48140 RepID=A0A9P3LHK0_9APHY|nr:hypothetical protein PsYK624_115940 [Phanerochaete sordida]